MNNLLRVLTIFAIALLAWQQVQMSRQMQDWQHRLAAATLSVDARDTANQPVNIQEDLASLRRDLVYLRQLLLAEEKIKIAPASGDKTIPAANDGSTAISESAGFTTTIDNTLALGVIDSQSWVDMEADVAKLSPEQNRAFWIQVLGGIGSGELTVVPPEEDRVAGGTAQ
jgi:hypothetical protein